MSKDNKCKYKEIDAVMHFLKNEGINFKKDEVYGIDKTNSIIDVRYKNLNFQVKNVPAEAEEVDGRLDKEEEVRKRNVGGKWKEIVEEIGKTKNISWHYNPEEAWENFIYNPLIAVLRRYGENSLATNGVILILYGRNMIDCPFLPHLLQESKKIEFLSDIGRKIGFDSICFVSWNENTPLYPQDFKK